MSILLAPGAIRTSPPLGAGNSKRSPEDFLVDELGLDGTSARESVRQTERDPECPFVCCVLHKVDLSTTTALHLLARELGCPVQQLGIAGKKDVQAVTWQFCTVPAAYAHEVRLPGLALIPQRGVTSPLRIGDLTGNRFTIRVHTEVPANNVESRLLELEQNGLRAYFGPQRFGPRMLNHVVGEALLRAQYDEAVRLLVCEPSSSESAELATIRSSLARKWPDYRACSFLTANNAALRSEHTLLGSLALGESAHAAWSKLPVQSRFLVNAYGSYVFNQALSTVTPLPEVLPTLSVTSEAWYRSHNLISGVFDFAQRSLKNARPSHHQLATKIHPSFPTVEQEAESVLLSFSLPAGAYATTVLGELFA